MTDTLFFGGIAAAVIALNGCDFTTMSCCRLSTGGADSETARQAHESAAQGR